MRRLTKCMILYYWNQVALIIYLQKKILKIYSKWNYSNLPLETEDELEEFEKKLTDNKEFRMKLIAELKRFSRSTLPSTVLILLRKMFTDALLEKFSYKGLKKNASQVGDRHMQ